MGHKYKYCPFCGHKLDINDEFCIHCGRKLPNTSNPKTTKSDDKAIDKVKKSKSPKNNNTPNHTNSPIIQWFKKRSHQVATVVAVILLFGIGAGTYHNYEMHHQQQASQQQGNQNQNNQSKPKPLTNYQRTKQVVGNLLNAIEPYTANGGKVQAPEKNNHNKLHTFISTHDLSLYYLHGTDNPSFKQILHWSENQAKGKTPVRFSFDNFHLHHVSGNEYYETYRVYYEFMHQPTPQADDSDSGGKVHIKYQSVEWHTLIKKLYVHGGYHWFIVKSKSGSHVSKPSHNTLIKVGLEQENKSTE